ncbi:MAG: hypothetical protein JWP97_2710 [Labilithrix sp.]|nr:hypothetical protein [Labilithrix sp.]
MTGRALAALLLAYALLLGIACLVVRGHVALTPLAVPVVIESDWAAGQRVGRRVGTAPGSGSSVRERLVAVAPLPMSDALLPLSLVAGRDGVRAQLDGRTAYVTPDDLLHARAYDHASTVLDPTLGVGAHRATVLHLVARELGTTPAEVVARAHVERARFEPATPVPLPVVDRATVRDAVLASAAYLARGVGEDGRYRYLVDAVSGEAAGGYNWPRHAGATYFLAQAAALTEDTGLRAACLRAAARLRDEQLVSCGTERCIADGPEADVGSSALALLAFSELVTSGLDASYRPAALALASFLRSMQRPDGELRHLYDRTASRPLDRQLPFFTGEASFALARAYLVSADERDQAAASRALAYLTGPGWSFFGSRYFWSEEHWTCQAVAELWDRAPDPASLDFCLRWHEFQRHFQDEEGAFAFGAPVVTPRTTTTAARAEGAAAALDVVGRSDGVAKRHDAAAALEVELRSALAFLLRAQLRPGPRHLFAEPDRVTGGTPGSTVDLQIRIDYVQHAGSAMIRWLALEQRGDVVIDHR